MRSCDYKRERETYRQRQKESYNDIFSTVPDNRILRNTAVHVQFDQSYSCVVRWELRILIVSYPSASFSNLRAAQGFRGGRSSHQTEKTVGEAASTRTDSCE